MVVSRANPINFGRQLLCALSLSTLMFITASCNTNDGYRTFNKGTNYDFNFEYPKEWENIFLEDLGDTQSVAISDEVASENESPVKLDIVIFSNLGASAEEKAKEIISHEVQISKGIQGYQLLKNETVTLDGYEGYICEYNEDVIASYLVPPSMRFYIHSRTLRIAIPRNGNVYDIWISASQNEWNKFNKEIEHILNTFRWK